MQIATSCFWFALAASTLYLVSKRPRSLASLVILAATLIILGWVGLAVR